MYYIYQDSMSQIVTLWYASLYKTATHNNKALAEVSGAGARNVPVCVYIMSNTSEACLQKSSYERPKSWIFPRFLT